MNKKIVTQCCNHPLAGNNLGPSSPPAPRSHQGLSSHPCTYVKIDLLKGLPEEGRQFCLAVGYSNELLVVDLLKGNRDEGHVGCRQLLSEGKIPQNRLQLLALGYIPPLGDVPPDQLQVGFVLSLEGPSQLAVEFLVAEQLLADEGDCLLDIPVGFEVGCTHLVGNVPDDGVGLLEQLGLEDLEGSLNQHSETGSGGGYGLDLAEGVEGADKLALLLGLGGEEDSEADFVGEEVVEQEAKKILIIQLGILGKFLEVLSESWVLQEGGVDPLDFPFNLAVLGEDVVHEIGSEDVVPELGLVAALDGEGEDMALEGLLLLQVLLLDLPLPLGGYWLLFPLIVPHTVCVVTNIIISFLGPWTWIVVVLFLPKIVSLVVLGVVELLILPLKYVGFLLEALVLGLLKRVVLVTVLPVELRIAVFCYVYFVDLKGRFLFLEGAVALDLGRGIVLVPQQLPYFFLDANIFLPQLLFPVLLPLVPVLNIEKALDGVGLQLIINEVGLIEDGSPALPLSLLLNLPQIDFQPVFIFQNSPYLGNSVAFKVELLGEHLIALLLKGADGSIEVLFGLGTVVGLEAALGSIAEVDRVLGRQADGGVQIAIGSPVVVELSVKKSPVVEEG